MLPVEYNQDLYGADDGGYVLGENGDGTGSPYFTIDFSGYGQEGTVVQTVKTEVVNNTSTVTPEIIQSTDDAKKNWVDVIEQLGGTAAGLITAIKAPPGTVITDPNISGSVGVNAGNNYTPSVDDKKKNNTVWIILAIVLIAVLLYLAFKKDK
jgi:hypothetical protein